MACTLDLETAQWDAGCDLVAGVDEAGRGPLAGPVLTAAVILPRAFSHAVLTDSKKLSPKKRDALYEELTNSTDIVWASDRAEPKEIDRINILKATHVSMARAVAKLPDVPDMVLIDGLAVKGFPYSQQAVVKGDSLSLSIAAASIIAKVERDRYMCEMAEKYPEYGFEKHKGYPTKFHVAQLQKLGPCLIHRMSFGPVAQQMFDFDEKKK
ncbi:MAG: ribonuclease HII [Verrucomicrobiales bacterium]|jgi:ribonuclease HII